MEFDPLIHCVEEGISLFATDAIIANLGDLCFKRGKTTLLNSIGA